MLALKMGDESRGSHASSVLEPGLCESISKGQRPDLWMPPWPRSSPTSPLYTEKDSGTSRATRSAPPIYTGHREQGAPSTQQGGSARLAWWAWPWGLRTATGTPAHRPPTPQASGRDTWRPTSEALGRHSPCSCHTLPLPRTLAPRWVGTRVPQVQNSLEETATWPTEYLTNSTHPECPWGEGPCDAGRTLPTRGFSETS